MLFEKAEAVERSKSKAKPDQEVPISADSAKTPGADGPEKTEANASGASPESQVMLKGWFYLSYT